MQAKDLDTVKLLSLTNERDYIYIEQIQRLFPDAPTKLIDAKLYILARKGFIERFYHGDNGMGFVVTQKGKTFFNDEIKKRFNDAQSHEE